MNRTIEMVIIKPIKDFAENVLDFLPNLLAALLIFFVGITIAVVINFLGKHPIPSLFYFD